MLLKVEDPLTKSAFKTTLTVESRELDPAAAPPLQELVDRRIEQRSARSATTSWPRTRPVSMRPDATQLEYAYIVQPIDEPRRPSLPVVVHAREYVISAGDISYYITLAAPADEFAGASEALDRIIGLDAAAALKNKEQTGAPRTCAAAPPSPPRQERYNHER